MSERYFDNFMLKYVEEKASVPGIEEEQDDNEDSLLKLLKMPYPTLCEKLKRTALDLKETVFYPFLVFKLLLHNSCKMRHKRFLLETRVMITKMMETRKKLLILLPHHRRIVVETWGYTGQKVQDFTIYTGTLGTAFLLLKSYQVTNNKNDLDLSSEIIKACDSASSGSSVVSFLSGRAGVCALGAVVAKHQGNEQMVDYYLSQFKEIKVTEDGPVELILGRTGYLWACLFLNKNLGDGTIPELKTSPMSGSFKTPKKAKKLINQQLEALMPEIVNHVSAQMGNGTHQEGAGTGGSGSNGCTYKEFVACKPKEYDGRGGANTLTHWIEKMEQVMDISGCTEGQKVKYVASSLINKALTWWNTQIQARGRVAALAMT
ncbi:Lanthionine synthetase C-like protein [Artemisia annua]|uniref:Lanthionine synthetase C-like protein n=1 Tax=Artemisia annua TaxID=35608 RepID=A0A2U1MZW3_ARTAN|nr:Lanthionine synthetase C-like protein [Artemisia annua]